jgi:ABC-type multidrug transport system fused ATPase/permease subunit
MASHLPATLRHLLMACAGAALMLWVAPGPTAAVALLAPPLLVAARASGRRVRRHVREAQESLQRALGVAEQSIAALPTLRAHAAERETSERFARAVEDSVTAARRRAVVNGAFIGATMTALLSVVALVVWWAGYRVARGQMALGDLIEWLAYQGAATMALAGLSDGWSEFVRATTAVERLSILLGQPPVRGMLRPPGVLGGGLSFEAVTYRPPGAAVDAVHDVTFRVPVGEWWAVVGPSGSGKSTLCRLAWGLHAPDSGRVTAGGRDLRTLDLAWWRREVGIVLQEPMLVPGTMVENLRLGRPDLDDLQVRAAARDMVIDDVVDALPDGFATRIETGAGGFSGGERQRLTLARALARNPSLLILDEPTSALDPGVAAAVHAALRNRLTGRTALVVTHRLDLARWADRIVVMENGRVVESGTHEELMSPPGGAYRRLAGLEDSLATGAGL